MSGKPSFDERHAELYSEFREPKSDREFAAKSEYMAINWLAFRRMFSGTLPEHRLDELSEYFSAELNRISSDMGTRDEMLLGACDEKKPLVVRAEIYADAIGHPWRQLLLRARNLETQLSESERRLVYGGVLKNMDFGEGMIPAAVPSPVYTMLASEYERSFRQWLSSRCEVMDPGPGHEYEYHEEITDGNGVRHVFRAFRRIRKCD